MDKRKARVLVALSPTALSATSEGVLHEQQCDLGRCALSPSRKKAGQKLRTTVSARSTALEGQTIVRVTGSWARTIDDGLEGKMMFGLGQAVVCDGKLTDGFSGAQRTGRQLTG